MSKDLLIEWDVCVKRSGRESLSKKRLMEFRSNRDDDDQGMWDRRAMHCPTGVPCVTVQDVRRFIRVMSEGERL